MKRFVWMTFAGCLLCLGGCASNGAPSPQRLTVTPVAGSPGTVLSVTGLELGATDTFQVWLGDVSAPGRLEADGSISVAIPLFMGAGGWPDPPVAPQGLEIRRGDVVLGRAGEEVTVTPLPEAPGSTAAVVDALSGVATSYDSLFAALPVRTEADRAIREGVVAALEGLASDDPNSLRALLAGSAPLLGGTTIDVGLLDALLASSGALDYFTSYAGALRSSADALSSQSSSYCNDEGNAFDLACLMQIYVVLDDYSKAFVKPTAEGYANTVGLEFGILAVGGVEYPPAAIIGAVLSVADFIMEKIAPALFPSTLSQFELQMLQKTIDVGETTNSAILVSGVNNPPPIRYLDMIEQVKTMAGLKNIKFSDELNGMLKAAADLFIDLYLKVVKSYEAGHPGTYPWVTAGDVRIPKMSWGPFVVTSDRLVKLFSFEESVVATHEQDLEWEGVQLGESNVRVMPRGPGEKSKVLIDNALCFGCVYGGGAFGNEMPESKVKVVVGDVRLTATPPTGAAPLTTTFAWTGIETQAEPLTCTLDPGDGTDSITISDCAATTSAQHSYPYAAALREPTGAYHATLSIVGTKKSVSTDVTVDWRFTATPGTGKPPFDVSFDWGGLDPSLAPLSCTFDPGDGGASRSIADCLGTHTITHTYTDTGTFVASLTVNGAGGETVRTVPVSSQVTATCIDPSEVAGWQGVVTVHYDKTVAWEGGSSTVKRTANVQVTLDDFYDAAGGPVWRGEVVGGTAVFQDSGGDHAAIGTSLEAHRADEASISFTAPEGVCRSWLTVKIVVAPVNVTEPDYDQDYPYATVAYVSLLEPVTSTTRLHGDTLLPTFSDSSADRSEGVVDLNDGWNPPIGLEFGSAGVGTASVTWDLTAIPR